MGDGRHDHADYPTANSLCLYLVFAEGREGVECGRDIGSQSRTPQFLQETRKGRIYTHLENPTWHKGGTYNTAYLSITWLYTSVLPHVNPIK